MITDVRTFGNTSSAPVAGTTCFGRNEGQALRIFRALRDDAVVGNVKWGQLYKRDGMTYLSWGGGLNG